jgi:hypothetical protein
MSENFTGISLSLLRVRSLVTGTEPRDLITSASPRRTVFTPNQAFTLTFLLQRFLLVPRLPLGFIQCKPLQSHSLKLIQHNTARSSRYIDSYLDTAVKNQIDCIFIQEPYFLDNSYTTIVTHSAYHCMFSRGQATTKIRPRVAVFARKKSRF